MGSSVPDLRRSCCPHLWTCPNVLWQQPGCPPPRSWTDSGWPETSSWGRWWCPWLNPGQLCTPGGQEEKWISPNGALQQRTEWQPGQVASLMVPRVYTFVIYSYTCPCRNALYGVLDKITAQDLTGALGSVSQIISVCLVEQKTQSEICLLRTIEGGQLTAPDPQKFDKEQWV